MDVVSSAEKFQPGLRGGCHIGSHRSKGLCQPDIGNGLRGRKAAVKGSLQENLQDW